MAKEKYIEIEKTDWKEVFAIIIFYPIFATIGIIFSLIPVINSRDFWVEDETEQNEFSHPEYSLFKELRKGIKYKQKIPIKEK